LQLIMVAAVVAYPELVSGGIEKVQKIDADKALETMGLPPADVPAAMPASGAASGAESGSKSAEDDPMKALEDAIKKDAAAPKKP
jgi:hypothetical protein